jgi:subtilisin-like proprotein convertase family protein
MKTQLVARLLALGLLAGGGHAAWAGIYTYIFSGDLPNSGQIPDGNPAGWSDTRTLSSIPDLSITDVNVTLSVSGGYNGDMYAYLSHGSGFTVLLNRVGRTSGDGFGYGDAGYVITLNDQASETTDIHLYQTVLNWSVTGGAAWRPDGRNVNPASVLDTDTRSALLSQFNGVNPNGSWTLFVADMSGTAQSTVNSWGLEVTAVPEPVNAALGLFGVGAAALQLWRWRWSRRGVR